MQCEAMIIDIQQVSQHRPWRKCQSIHQFRHPPGFQLLLQACFRGEFFCMTASWLKSPLWSALKPPRILAPLKSREPTSGKSTHEEIQS